MAKLEACRGDGSEEMARKGQKMAFGREHVVRIVTMKWVLFIEKKV